MLYIRWVFMKTCCKQGLKHTYKQIYTKSSIFWFFPSISRLLCSFFKPQQTPDMWRMRLNFCFHTGAFRNPGFDPILFNFLINDNGNFQSRRDKHPSVSAPARFHSCYKCMSGAHHITKTHRLLQKEGMLGPKKTFLLTAEHVKVKTKGFMSGSEWTSLCLVSKMWCVVQKGS